MAAPAPSNAPVAKDTNYAPEYLISCGLLTLLALALCIARIYSRLQPRPHLLPLEPRFSPDDYLIAGATVRNVGKLGPMLKPFE